MRCSSFEPLLDDFIDGTLPPLKNAHVLRHVERCQHCRGLLEELRVIDALLLTPRQLEPVANFTFKTMAEVRSMPPPHVHRTPALRVVLAYLVFAWVAIAAWLVLGGESSRATLAFLAKAAMQDGAGISTLAHAAARVFGVATPDVGVAMIAVLIFDLLLAAVVLAVHAVMRPRPRRWTQSSEGS
ncbi:MAG: zf-HC2 domain-containing protein [Candidatus Eremiobacteraeota bacterium]|nr:zf-HC2 domain-containing protein [Candidatus Eremiobacteraeota bacterium]